MPDLFLSECTHKRAYTGEKFRIPGKVIHHLYLYNFITPIVYRNFKIRKLYDILHFELGHSCNESIKMLAEMEWNVGGQASWISEGGVRRTIFYEVKKETRQLITAKILSRKLRIRVEPQTQPQENAPPLF